MVTCTITPCRAAVRLNSGVRFDMRDFRNLLLALAAISTVNAAATEPAQQPVQSVGVSGADASAVIRVCADKNGRPYDISMVQSSGDKKMDRAVFQAAKRWKFPHVRPDGTERPECEDVPVSMRVN